MSEQLQVLALPFVACLILTGIHAYLGIHVLSRKVIFVDIALAQIAALGATVAFLRGHDPRSEAAYWFSLVFAVLAAGIFALTRTRVERVPQEAIIGLTYAVASAAAILLADISPHGAEHLKDLMAGSIVWVTPHQVIKTGILYSAIGLFHFVFRKRFLMISMHPEEAYAKGINVRLWDFLFYLSFSVVITSSVQIAGVLLVFCYLVAPAVFAFMLSDSLKTRLALGWTAGTVVSAAGLLFSYDRPSGPMIMVCFAVALILGGMARAIFMTAGRGRTGALATAGVALIAIAGYAVIRLALPPDEDHEHGEGASTHALEAARDLAESHGIGSTAEDLRLALSDSHAAVRVAAVEALAARGEINAAPDIMAALQDSSTAVRESAAKALGMLGDADAVPALESVMRRAEEDEWVRLRAAESVAMLGEPQGIAALLSLARDAEARMARIAALERLCALSGMGAAGPSGAGEAETDQRLAILERWYEENGASLRWDSERGTYRPRAKAP